MSNDLDAIDYELGTGAVLAQLGGLAQQAAWYSDKYYALRYKHWPSVLAWNISLGALINHCGIIDALMEALDKADYWSALAKSGEWSTSPDRWHINGKFESDQSIIAELRNKFRPNK